MITIVFEPLNKRAAAYLYEKRIGVCTYEERDGEWAIMHTIVDPEFGGRGIARQLVEEILLEAGRAGVKVVPVCSYAAKVMEEKGI